MISLEIYFRSFDNADEVICGCGCNCMIPISHGLVQRIEKDINHILEFNKEVGK